MYLTSASVLPGAERRAPSDRSDCFRLREIISHVSPQRAGAFSVLLLRLPLAGATRERRYIENFILAYSFLVDDLTHILQDAGKDKLH
jgi:hypothetical protein